MSEIMLEKKLSRKYRINHLKIGIFIGIVLSIVMFVFPGIDLWISDSFFSSEEKGFILKENIFIRYLNSYNFIFLLIPFVALWRYQRPKGVRFRAFISNFNIWPTVYLLVVLIIGSGVIINGVFKPLFLRPRPDQVDIFGGLAFFQRAWELGRHCYDFVNYDCASFVSGHVSVAGVFFSIAFCMKEKASYMKWIIVTIVLCTFVSFARIAAGKHFFSDAFFAMWIMWACAAILDIKMNPNNKYVRLRSVFSRK